MARIQQKSTGRRVRGEKVRALDWKSALSKWSREKESAPPPRFGEVKPRRRSSGAGKEGA